MVLDAKCVYRLSQDAEALCARGQYRDAESLYRQALTLAENIFGVDHLDVATILNNLAVLYKYMGRFAEAGPLYQRALWITEKALGREHTDVATIYHNLGGLEHAAGNYLRGEPLSRRALEIRERVLGPDHPETAADAAALAAVLDGQGHYDEAECLYRRALGIFESVYGPEHLEIAVNLNNLAAIAYARGRNDEAEQLFERALAIKERALGSEHPDVAMTLNNLAIFYKSGKKYDRAESLYQRALSIFEQALGPDHFKVAACLDNYARLLWKMGRTDEARELNFRAKAILSSLGVRARNDVVATATINPQFASFAMSVRTSGIHRWGVFSEEQIPTERQVIEYIGERIRLSEAERRRRSLHYLFRLDEQWVLDGAVGGSGAELINHSCAPNLCSQLIQGRIFYVSKRRIEAGEELTVDYSFAPDPRPQLCRCGSSKCRGTINTKPATVGPPGLPTRPIG